MDMQLCTETSVSGNRILAGLSSEVMERLAPCLRQMPLHQHDVLYRCGDSLHYVYFPLESAVISVLAATEDGRSVEVAMAGSEAALGVQAVLGAKRAFNIAVVQFPGAGFKIAAETLQHEFERGGEIQERIFGYVRYALLEASQTAACNRMHHLKQRLFRWLLGAQNRVKKNEFPATHEMLSQALGTPRSEITITAGALRKAGIIDYKRGSIVIRDRRRLEEAVCECYHVINRTETIWHSGFTFKKVPPAVLRIPIRVNHRPPRFPRVSSERRA